MSLSNFLKTVDPAVHKQYAFEKFKDGHTGRNFVVEEPKFNFEPPKFKPKLDLPKASKNQIAKQYLEKRKIDSTKFYYTDTFKRWVNTLVTKFDDVSYDEPRIIIPLIYENQRDPFTKATTGCSIAPFDELNNGFNILTDCGLDIITTAPNAPIAVQTLRSNTDSLERMLT